MLNLRRNTLTLATPLSIERELAFFHRSGQPLARAHALELQERLRTGLNRVSCQTEVVERATFSSLEIITRG